MNTKNERPKIDLNLDAGEIPELLTNGKEEKLFQLVTSVNIACGGHVGDPQSILETFRRAKKYKLNVGAHPSYPDRENFGRKAIEIDPQVLKDDLKKQIQQVAKVSTTENYPLTHVKPHGALYNVLALAHQHVDAFIEAVKETNPDLWVLGLAGSKFLDLCQKAGLKVIHEAFADRSYESNGQLRGRSHSDALIENAELAGQQAVEIVLNQSVKAINGDQIKIHAQTLCIHGDHPKALEVALGIRRALEKAEIKIEKFY